MTKVIVLGGAGMLGHQLCKSLAADGKYEIATTVRRNKAELQNFSFFEKIKIYENIDITGENFLSLENVIREFQPQIIINTIGLFPNPSVSDSDLILVNSLLPHTIYDICERLLSDFYIITISTDAVFNGKRGLYSEQDTPNAEDLYGISKYRGELNKSKALTIRTSIYGRDPLHHKGLLEWFLNSAENIAGYTNVYFSGVSTTFLSDAIVSIVNKNEKITGIQHICSERISKHDLLCLFNNFLSSKKIIIPQPNPVKDLSLVSIRSNNWESVSHEYMISEIGLDLSTR